MELNKGQFLIIIAVLVIFSFLTSFEGSIITGSVIEIKEFNLQGEPCASDNQCITGLVCSDSVCTTIDAQVDYYTDRLKENPLDRNLIPWEKINRGVSNRVTSYLNSLDFYYFAAEKQRQGETKDNLNIATRYDLNQDGCVDVEDYDSLDFVIANKGYSSDKYDLNKDGVVNIEDRSVIEDNLGKAQACPIYVGDFDNDRCVDNNDKALLKFNIGNSSENLKFDITNDNNVNETDFKLFRAAYGNGDRCELDVLKGDFDNDKCVNDRDLGEFDNAGLGQSLKYDLDGDGFVDNIDRVILQNSFGGENCETVIVKNNDFVLNRLERFIEENARFKSSTGNLITLADSKVQLNFSLSEDVEVDLNARYLYSNPVSGGIGLNFVEIEPGENINDKINSVVLTMRYSDIDVIDLGLNESLLTVYFYNGETWDELDSVVNLTLNEITATTDHLSLFGIFEQGTIQLPSTTQTSSSGGSSGSSGSGGKKTFVRGSTGGSGPLVVPDDPLPEPEVVIPDIVENEVVSEKELAKGVLNLISKILIVVLLVAFGYLILKRVLKH